MLIEALNADLNIQNTEGKTALELAIEYKCDVIIESIKRKQMENEINENSQKKQEEEITG